MKENLSLYIHIPFCVQKCLYCDFPSWGGCENEHENYVKSLCDEIKQSASQFKDYNVDTIFMGGGTPTIL
ncbi:MAG: coproporphyrinogen III oxidase, partial [Firmicutes bacterium]|nr:coproporphyrinogen III oxidase [Bacillota bacterium]